MEKTEKFNEDKSKGGRPRSTLLNELSQTVKFRLTIDEKAALKKSALEAKMSMSNYIRQKLSDPSSTPSFSPDALSALAEINNILNQANSVMNPSVAEKFKEQMARISKSMES